MFRISENKIKKVKTDEKTIDRNKQLHKALKSMKCLHLYEDLVSKDTTYSDVLALTLEDLKELGVFKLSRYRILRGIENKFQKEGNYNSRLEIGNT